MRPKIVPCKSLAKSLVYNEEKVAHKQAECILAQNFLKDLPRLTLEDKLSRFRRLSELNERVTTSQHITLNFDPLDQLSNDQMKQIAKIYMKEIGFERQPYLVYRHHDAGHPHCHIVTSHIQRDGAPMDLYNIGRNQSEKARLHIEKEFNLVTKEMKQQLRLQQIQQRQKIDGVQKVSYGKGSTARSVSDVLEYVTENYKYSSLEELNAILRLYNVEAYRGKEGSQLYQHRGLLYRVLDEHGNYIGVPLKASFFDCKPTLDRLEEKMKLNLSLKMQHKERLTTYILWGLLEHPNKIHKPDNLEKFYRNLGNERIRMILKLDKEGNCTDATYVDFSSKCVYDSKDLHEGCSVQAIQKLIERDRTRRQQESLTQSQDLRHSHRHHLRHSLGLSL